LKGKFGSALSGIKAGSGNNASIPEEGSDEPWQEYEDEG
jgi:hypothetical protein